MEIHFADCKIFIFKKLDNINPARLPAMKNNFVQLMAESVRCAVDAGYDLREVDSARFALIALVDEKIMENKSLAKEWSGMTLQETFYDITNAGSVFFHRLKQDLKLKRRSAWLYWWCLLAGFKGEYCHATISERRNRLIMDVYKQCRAIEMDS